MSGLIAFRDTTREILRKYDEIITPLFKFIGAYLVFWSINIMYGYSDLFGRGLVTFLLSVICALISNSFMVLVVGAVVIVNAFAVSLEVGILMLLVFIVIYCLYIRLFPNSSWILLLVPLLYILKLQFAIPVVVVIFSGITGIVSVAFGIILYYLSGSVAEVVSLLNTTSEEEKVESYSYIIDSITHNKEMILTIIVFAVVILLTYVIYRLSVDYAWYIAIAVGSLLTLLLFIVGSAVLEVEISFGSVFFGVIVGAIVGLIIQATKSLVDYSRKETVQFEDDEYYYYVKAIPKVGAEAKNVEVKKITEAKKMPVTDTPKKKPVADTAKKK